MQRLEIMKTGRVFLNKLLLLFLVVVVVIGSNVGGFVFADGAETQEKLFLRGDGISKELQFTRSELAAMTEEVVQKEYSSTNNFPSTKTMYRKGILLESLLTLAGIKDSAEKLTFTSSDGYARTFTVKELLEDKRYVFAADGSRQEVPLMIAFSDSPKGFDSLSDMELTLTMGQRVCGEQTNPWFVKYLETIEVSTTKAEQWAAPTFTKSVGAEGVSVTPNHTNLDMLKIYYTTDGSQPTLDSQVYNVSATYYQPQINLPILVSKDTEIRAIAIGAGKEDSPVATTAVSFGGSRFTDLSGYAWAKIAIEDLAEKKIINGMGGTRFAPEQTLTRAQFATMMVLAMGESKGLATGSTFSDVTSADWFAPYVNKAAEKGWIKGYKDGTFGPEKTLSREEMAVILVQVLQKDPAGSVTQEQLKPFAAEKRISNWALPYVAWAESLGLIEHGHMAMETAEGLSYNSQQKALRAEAA
ncbi:MAG: S-layer homology domain-containing protein, partial [Eubacteriales bacterium]|nr:S-layer homology domain-containing protein [Eubacteriales bacterium]